MVDPESRARPGGGRRRLPSPQGGGVSLWRLVPGTRRRLDTPDWRIASVAARQHGVVTISQLLQVGFSHAAVQRREQSGRFYRLYRGTYAIGHSALRDEGRWKAATMALGAAAALSHRSAAELWGMLERGGGDIHLTVPYGSGRSKRAGLQVHRSRTLVPALIRRKSNIPLTAPGRTLQDLRHQVAPSTLRGALRQAELINLPVGGFGLVLGRTKSELERLFLRLCRRAGLPEPEVDYPIDRFRADFAWPRQRVIVETDGYRYHRGSVAFEADHARDNRLMSLGWDVIRFTYWRVVHEPADVTALLALRLERAGGSRRVL